MLRFNVRKYKDRHSCVYLFFSKLFYGDINKICSNLIKQLESIRRDGPRPPAPVNPIHRPIENPNHEPFNPVHNWRPNPNRPIENPHVLNPINWLNPVNVDPWRNGPDFFNPGRHNLPNNPVKLPPEPINPQRPQAPANAYVKPKPNPLTPSFDIRTLPAIEILPPERKQVQAPIAEEKIELGRVLESSRLKFYELFAEKFQMANDGNAIRLPFMNISPQGVSIRLNKLLNDNGFAAWLEELCKKEDVVYQRKAIIPNNDHRHTIEFTLSLEEAQKLIKAPTPNKGLNHLAKFTGQNEFRFKSCSKIQQNENVPDVENTIAYNLVQLDSSFKLEEGLPVVKFSETGLSLKLNDHSVKLKEILTQVFGFKCEDINETINTKKYSYEFKFSRDQIENVLNLLGLDKIPPDGLSDRFNSGEITYINYLKEIKLYHPYQPVKTLDALESIKESIKIIVPNENQTVPHVAYHPRGWVSVMIPQGNDDYVQKLSAFLNCQPLKINKEFNKTHYDREFRIYHDDMGSLENFLKKLKLDVSPEGYPYLDILNDFNPKITPVYAASGNDELNFLQTLSRTLSALNPKFKEQSKIFSPVDMPELSDLALVQTEYNQNGIDIKIPKILNDDPIHIGPKTTQSLGQYSIECFRH